jgi:hypothetical protein
VKLSIDDKRRLGVQACSSCNMQSVGGKSS